MSLSLPKKFISPLYHIFFAGCLAKDDKTMVTACLAGCDIARVSMETNEMEEEDMDENHNTRERLERNNFDRGAMLKIVDVNDSAEKDI